jgi:hypothetical protein
VRILPRKRNVPNCAACGHAKYRHKVEQAEGTRVCLNMSCPCPDYKDPSVVGKIETVERSGDGHLVIKGKVMPSMSEIVEDAQATRAEATWRGGAGENRSESEGDLPKMVDTHGHPMVEHIDILGHTYPATTVHNYFEGAADDIKNDFFTWVRDKAESDRTFAFKKDDLKFTLPEDQITFSGGTECFCGHSIWQHARVELNGPNKCLSEDCLCSMFRFYTGEDKER